MNAVGRTFVVVLLLVLAPAAATGGAAVSADASADTRHESTVDRLALQEEPDSDADNETVRHRNPDEYDEDGDEEELERWLSGWLSGQLEEGAVELSEGEYDLAREYVDEEYRDRLSQYVEVTGGGEAADSFDTAQREQERMTEAIAEYEETKEEYEEAREAGDSERARELARELERLADEIGDSSQGVQDHYDAIGEDTDLDLSDAATEIEAANEEIQAEQEEIRESEFVETALTVTAETTDISYTDPLVATGELRTADGAAVTYEEIRLDVGNQTIRTTTDGAGAFTFEYRPISVPLSADSVSVEYVPENQSAYLGDEANVSVSIEQVEPTLTVTSVEPETVAYGETVAADAEVTVDGEPIDDVPLAVTIDGVSLGLLEPDSETRNESEPLPADVPSGERGLTVSLPFSDRALANAEATTTITVAETEPALSVSATRTDDREVSVDGALEVDGAGVESQSVHVVADGERLETLTTDENGEFEGTVSVPAGTASGDVQLLAVHDDDGTNLARTDAATTVSFPGGNDWLLPTWAWLALGVFVVGGGVGLYRYRRTTGSEPESPGPVEDDPHPRPTAEGPADPTASRRLLSRATEQLSGGNPNDAVQHCYAAVRGALASRIGAPGSLTHWEFYWRYRERGSDADPDSLRDVTVGYERAAFGRDGLSVREAETILQRARELCGIDESDHASAGDD